MKTQYLLKGVNNVTVTMFSDVNDKKEAETKALNKNNIGLAPQLFPGIVHKNNMKRLSDQGATDCRFIPV